MVVAETCCKREIGVNSKTTKGASMVKRGEFCLVAIIIFAVALFASAQGGMGTAPIDPSILVEFDIRGEATFLVIFQEKADLAPAYEIQDWGERGEFVYDRLVATAAASQAGVRDVLRAWGAEVRPFWIVNAIEVTTKTDALVTVLAAHPEVAEIVAPPTVENYEMFRGTGGADERTIEWNIEHIGAPMVWSQFGVRGEGIVIGIVDTGVQYDHPALVEQYRGNLGGGVFDHNYSWVDISNQCTDPHVPCDMDGHGTGAAGLAVGDDGGVNQIGVAPGARFITAAVLNGGGASGWLAAMEWMLAPTDLNGENPRPDLRPHVINNSWGFYPTINFFLPAVQAWVAAGIFPVAAAGNEGPTCGTIRSPGNYAESYTVVAHDSDNNIWDGSSRGDVSLGWVKPDIAAPAQNIRTSWPPDLYVTGDGKTSGATVHVTGTVALMWSVSPELIGEVERTRLHLDTAAIDVSDLSCGGDPGDNNVWGEGRLDAFTAASIVFLDGFESGGTSAWSTTALGS